MSLPGLFLKLSLEEPTAVKQKKPRHEWGKESLANRMQKRDLSEKLSAIGKRNRAAQAGQSDEQKAATQEAAIRAAEERNQRRQRIAANAAWVKKWQRYDNYLAFIDLDKRWKSLQTRNNRVSGLQREQMEIDEQQNKLRRQYAKSKKMPSGVQWQIDRLQYQFDERKREILDIAKDWKAFPKPLWDEGKKEFYKDEDKLKQLRPPQKNPPFPEEYSAQGPRATPEELARARKARAAILDTIPLRATPEELAQAAKSERDFGAPSQPPAVVQEEEPMEEDDPEDDPEDDSGYLSDEWLELERELEAKLERKESDHDPEEFDPEATRLRPRPEDLLKHYGVSSSTSSLSSPKRSSSSITSSPL